MSKPSKPTTRAAASDDCMNLRSSTTVLKTPTPTNKPPPGHIKNIGSVIKSKSCDITSYLEKAKSSVIKQKEQDKVEHQLVENPDPQVEVDIDMIEKNWDEVVGEDIHLQSDEDNINSVKRVKIADGDVNNIRLDLTGDDIEEAQVKNKTNDIDEFMTKMVHMHEQYPDVIQSINNITKGYDKVQLEITGFRAFQSKVSTDIYEREEKVRELTRKMQFTIDKLVRNQNKLE